MLFRLVFSLVALVLIGTSHAQLVISEFLASNSNGLQDELGNEEDWVEIQNTSGATVNLGGWYLTDESSNLRKWPVPAWTLAAGNRMVAFASNRSKTPVQTTAGVDNAGTPASPRLATNFKIGAGAGGYLALTKDEAGGALTVVSVFASYPKQVMDISYGLSQTTTALVTSSSATKALVPTVGNGGSGLGTTWQGAAVNEPFADGAWQSGTLGVGVAGTATLVGSANLKLRLEATSLAAIATDTSGAAHSGANTGGTTSWLATTTDTTTTPLLRRGVMQFSAVAASQITIPAHADFTATNGVIMFWMKAGNVIGGGSESAMLWDRRIGGVGGIIGLMNTTFNAANAGKLFFQPNGGGSSFYSTVRVDDNQWHHVAFVYNQAANGTDTFYVDGVARGAVTHGSAWAWPAAQQIELGRSHDGYWHTYNGLLDEVRFYNTGLSAGQIASIYNGADENVVAGDVGLSLAGTLPGNAGAFIRIPFTVSNPANFQTLRLTTRVNDGFVAYLNGAQIDSLNAPGSPAYNSVATATANAGRFRVTDLPVSGGTLNAGTNVLALHGMNNTTGDTNFLVQPTLDGVALDPAGNYLLSSTPGGANTGVRTNIGPFISNVTGDGSGSFPARPTGGAGSASITISATVAPSLRLLAASNPVQLAWRIMFGAETVVNMTAAAGGVYTAQIPTTGLAAGQMLRWRVIASDNSAVQSTAPSYLSATDSDQDYGTVALDGVTTQLPIYQLFVSGYATGNGHPIDNDGGGRGAIFYDGELYDNVFIRIKGDTTRYMTKRSHRVDFNSDHQFRWAAGEKRLRELALNCEYVDPSYSRQFLSMWLHRTFGTGAPNHFPVRAQMNGVFWQLAFHTETQDFELLDNMGLDPNGAMYASVGQMSGVSGEKQTRTTEGTTDMANFVTAITNANLTTRKNNVFDQIDIPAVLNFIAASRLTQEGDDVWANMVIHRDSDGTGEWRIVPFDTNLSWGQLYYADYPAGNLNVHATDDTNKSHPLYGNASCWTLNYAGYRYNRFYDAIISVPETRTMLLRRIRTLMDTWLQPPGTASPLLEAQLDAHVARIAPEAALDRAAWGWPPIGGPYGLGNDDLATAVNELKTLFLAPRRTHYFDTHTSQVNVGVANANSAGIPAAQAATFPMTIASYEYSPTGAGKQNEEYIEIANPNAFAADISGWMLSGAVSFTFEPGTVVNAGASVYVSPKSQVFRARATSPKGGEGRFVVGNYSGQISARGEVIELRNPAAALVTSVATPIAPTASQQQLRITELNFNPTLPTAAELLALPGLGASDFEFMELQNTGGTLLNVGGATFTKGITFTFPANYTIPSAGARVILVANQPAFTLRYGASATIAGTFAGNLDNSGESIEIVDGIGEVILDFRYENSWFPPADGAGRTLVVRNAAPNYATYDLPTHWALSGAVGGSPGGADADFANVYEGWLWDHFTEAEIYLPSPPNPSRTINTAFVGPAVDTEGDLLANLGEYAFGRLPRTPDNTALSTASIVNDAGSDYLAITFKRRHNALDLTYTIETTGSLVSGPWTPTTQQVGATADLGNGVEQVTFRDTIPVGPGQRFIRARAVK